MLNLIDLGLRHPQLQQIVQVFRNVELLAKILIKHFKNCVLKILFCSKQIVLREKEIVFPTKKNVFQNIKFFLFRQTYILFYRNNFFGEGEYYLPVLKNVYPGDKTFYSIDEFYIRVIKTVSYIKNFFIGRKKHLFL